MLSGYYFCNALCVQRRLTNIVQMQTLAQLKAGTLAGTTTLKLCENLSSFPEEIFTLKDTLEVLDLSGNLLTTLHDKLPHLSKLRILFCSGNPFKELPPILGECPSLDIVGFKACNIQDIPSAAINKNLRWLILTDNKISHLPETIGECSRLQKLMLAGNQITVLPEKLANCKRLELLRISANKLTRFPSFLLSMPRLAWLAFSGNPFCVTPVVPSLTCIPWHYISIGPKLGEGASGSIYRGYVTQNGTQTDVAVKVYKANMTSDGNPDDEMNATIAAGKYPGLLSVTGIVGHHPEGKKGLVMQLLTEEYKVLGLPPTFASCTRDVFTEGLTISLNLARDIAATVASVCAHLHACGIMHGDLYAHNILTNMADQTILSDFGASSFYDRTDGSLLLSEKIEVAAFGHLLEDLVSISCNDDTLLSIARMCKNPIVKHRPSFSTVAKLLAMPRATI